MHRIQLKLAAMALAALSFDVSSAPVQWTVADGGNDHWYEIVSVGTPAEGNPSLRKTWTDARADALSRTHLGLQGYLTTVTSAAENDFLDSLVGPFGTRGGWLGGSDAAVEGEWRWMDGPEAGMLFWLGDSTGSSPGYANWGRGWPNGEDYVEYQSGPWGSFPDVASSPRFYYVEYSAAPVPPPGGVPLPGTLSLAGLALGAGWLTRRRAAHPGSFNPPTGVTA